MKPSLLGPAPSISARHSKAPTREARNAAVNWKCCLASSLLVVLLLAPLAPAARGQETDRTWYRGNLHTHSLWSDGNDFPEMIADWYKSNGYHFLGLSDHNILSRGERWIAADTPQKRGAIQGIERYQARFGADGVETREVDGVAQVRLKNLDEVRGLLEEPGQFILIESEEITDSFENLPIHINATNIGELVRPQGGSSVRDTIDANLRAVEAQRIKLGRPILPHLNHPNFGWGVSALDLAAVERERFFEIFNGHPSVRQLGDDTHPSLERFWDIANTLRLSHYKTAPLMGLATDDSHHYFGGQGPTPGRGWVQVRAEALDPTKLLEAMEAGDFYASTGVTLREVSWDPVKAEVRIEIAPEEGVTYEIQFIGTRRLDAAGFELTEETTPTDLPETWGAVLETVTGTEGSFIVRDEFLYVRAVVISSKPHPNPAWSGQVEQAWTQPMGWRLPIPATPE